MVFAARYDNEDDAVADYEAVKDFYLENDLIDTYDAAVIDLVIRTRRQLTDAGLDAGADTITWHLVDRN